MLNNGRIALITGGSKGLGLSIARELSFNGSRVANFFFVVVVLVLLCLVAPNEENWHCSIKCDVTKEDEMIDAVKEIEKKMCGTVDILVNSAGISHDNLLIRESSHSIHSTLSTNLISSIFLSKLVLKGMIKKNRGHIINIGSSVGEYGNQGQSTYSASKAGLVGFTKSLAKEVNRYGILVNCVAPGFIETDMTSHISSSKREELLSKIAMRRFGHPDEVAKVVSFLCHSNTITGQVITVDGGLDL